MDRADELAQACEERIKESGGALQLVQRRAPFNVCFWWVPAQLRPYMPEQATPAAKALLSKVGPAPCTQPCGCGAPLAHGAPFQSSLQGQSCSQYKLDVLLEPGGMICTTTGTAPNHWPETGIRTWPESQLTLVCLDIIGLEWPS